MLLSKRKAICAYHRSVVSSFCFGPEDNWDLGLELFLHSINGEIFFSYFPVFMPGTDKRGSSHVCIEDL